MHLSPVPTPAHESFDWSSLARRVANLTNRNVVPHQRTDLSERGMQSLLLTNWSASTLHSRVDVCCCLAIVPSLASVSSTFASSTKPGQDHS
jgi:hypothetical protein